MTKIFGSIMLALTLCLIPGSVFAQTAVSIGEPGDSSYRLGNSSSYLRLTQSFTAVGTSLTSFQVPLARVGTPGTITVTVKSSLTGSTLYTGAINSSQVTSTSITSPTWVTLTPATPITVSSGATYFVTLSMSSANSKSYYRWRTNSMNAYSGGTFYKMESVQAGYDGLLRAAFGGSTAPAPAPAPAPSPSPTAPITLTNSSVSSDPLVAGTIQNMSATLSAGTSLSGLLVDLRIYNSSNALITRKGFEGVNIAAGTSATFLYGYQSLATLPPGTYSMVVGVWSTNYATTYLYETVKTFSVVAPSTSPPPPSYTLSLSSPASGATVSGTAQVIGTGSGFLNVEIYSASGVFLGRATPSATGAFSIPVNTTLLTNGTQVLTVSAWDSLPGQPFTHTAQATLSVNVQNGSVTPPPPPPPTYLLSLSSPASGATVSGTAQVIGTGSGFLNVEIYSASGVFLGRATPSATGAFSIPVNTALLANGTQVLTVNAWDSAPGQPYSNTAQVTRSVNVQNAGTTPAPSTQKPLIGVNIHAGAGTASANTQIVTIMQQRNFRTARVDLFWDMDKTLLRDMVTKIKANGGEAEASLQVQQQWDYTCNQDFNFVRQRAYDQAYLAVNAMKDVIYDYELLNEVQLRPEINNANVVPFGSGGDSVTVWQNKPCVNTLVAALKGMSQAIQDVRAQSGLPLRIMMGVISHDFGMLDYFISQGLVFDDVGYHHYPRANQALLMTDPWFGRGGLGPQLQRFGRPVHFNEFNCGETYDSNFDNIVGSVTSENCLKSETKYLTELRNQTYFNLHSIHLYELTDAPSKPVPENRFGVMYSLTQPKPQLYLVTAFAGGILSTSERAEITNRGLLTGAQIDAMKQI